MAEPSVKIHGYTELIKALKDAEKDTQKEVRGALRLVGERVRKDAFDRLVATTLDAKSAAGYKVRLRQKGVAVEQSLRKTTGFHPEYGALQMKHALIPALSDNTAETMIALEHAMDVVAKKFNNEGMVRL